MVSGKYRIHGRGACLLSLINIRDDPFRSSRPEGTNLPHVSDSTGVCETRFVVLKKRIWPTSGPRGKVFNRGSKKTAPRGAAGWTKAKSRGSFEHTFLARSGSQERIPRIQRAQGMARRRAGGAATRGRAGPQTMDAAAGGAAAAGTAGRRHLGALSPPPAPFWSPPPLVPSPSAAGSRSDS
jgi:hypothetical protein